MRSLAIRALAIQLRAVRDGAVCPVDAHCPPGRARSARRWLARGLGALAASGLACSSAVPSAVAPSGASGPAARGQAIIMAPSPAQDAASAIDAAASGIGAPASSTPSSSQPSAGGAGAPLELGSSTVRVVPQLAGWLGVALSAQPPDRAGVIVSSVLRRSPAALGGLLPGDVVVAIDDERVNEPRAMSRKVASLGAGRRASFMVQRQGADRLLSIELGHDPGYEGQLRLGFVDSGAPELQAVQVAQGAIGPTLEALRGRVVVLEFWATWCGACRALLPTLNEWHERLQGHGGLVLSVTTDPVGKAASDAAELGLRYPVLSDPEGMTAQAYQAFALPTLFVIDREGVVRDVSVGFDPERIAALQATVARLIDGG